MPPLPCVECNISPKLSLQRYYNIQTYVIRKVEKNGGVKGRNGSAVKLDRETGEEQTTVGSTCRKDGG